MADRSTLIKEIETLPPHFINEVFTFIGYLKMKIVKNNDVTFASESALAKEWLLPEEDAAWADL